MRKTASFMLVPLLCLAAAGLWAEGSAEQEKAAPEQQQGTIEYVEGKVTINGNPAENGMTVSEGAKVVTGSAARCDIVFAEQNVLRIFPDSAVVLDIPRGEAQLQRGALGAVFERLKSLVPDEDVFSFKSPTVAAGVRGTVFYIRSEDPDTTYFCTCHGKVDLEDPEGGHRNETANAKHGAFFYRRESGGYTTEKVGLRYHDTEGMNDIADRIGVSIPWGSEPE